MLSVYQIKYLKVCAYNIILWFGEHIIHIKLILGANETLHRVITKLFLVIQSVATDWAVEAMPTFMFLKEGKIVDKVVGAKKDELQQTINKHLATASA